MIKRYRGFADESEGAIVSLTGCVLPYEHWDAFTADWNAVLAENPKIKNFHMREARSSDGEFLRWNSADRDLKIIRLVSVLMQYKPLVLTTWLVRRDYDRIISEPLGIWEAGQCYVPCLFGLLYLAAAYSAVQKEKLPIDFVFDVKGKSLERTVTLWFGEVVSAASPELRPYFGSSPIFRDDLEMIPLQAADLVGWHIHRKLEVPGLDTERAATARLDELPQRAIQIDEANLRELAAQWFDVASSESNVLLTPLMQLKPSKRRKEVAKLKQKFKRRVENFYEQIKGIQGVRRNDEEADKRASREAESSAGCGESGEGSKKAED